MRIRFLNTYEPVNMLYRDLAPYLADEGIEVELVVTSVPYRAESGRLADALDHPNIRVTQIPAPGKPTGRSSIHKLAVMGSFLIGASLYTLFGRRTDLNVFLTQPPLFSAWGSVLRLVRRQRYACLLMDIYPDVAVADGMLSESAWATKLFRWLVRFSWRQADAIYVIGRAMKDRLVADGIDPRTVHVIGSWANHEVIFPVAPPENRLREQLGLTGKFVVLYSGNMGVAHSFDEILEVARRCQGEEDLVFVFTGDGSRRREIEAYVEQHDMDNVRLLPFQPTERLAESLGVGDVHFVSLRPGFEGLVVPSKTYGAWAAGRAVVFLGHPGGEIPRLIRELGLGETVLPGDVEGLGEVIRTYVREPAKAERQGARALNATQQELSRVRGVEAYRKLLVQAASTIPEQ